MEPASDGKLVRLLLTLRASLLRPLLLALLQRRGTPASRGGSRRRQRRRRRGDRGRLDAARRLARIRGARDRVGQRVSGGVDEVASDEQPLAEPRGRMAEVAARW